MSHRALVLYPSSSTSGTFDLHHSQNGASALKLYPALQAAIRAGDPYQPTKLNDIPDEVTDRIDELADAFDEDPREDPLVDPEPKHRQIPKAEFAQRIDFVQYEAVYLMHSTGDGRLEVDVYLPVFVDVGIVLFFARFIDLEVYERADVRGDPETVLSDIDEGQYTPSVTITNEEYLELGDNTEAFEYFVDSHLGILQTLYSLPPGHDKSEVLSAIFTEDAYIVARITDPDNVPLPAPDGRGILIRLPSSELEYEQLATLYADWRYLTDRLRVQQSQKAAGELIEQYTSTGDVVESLTAEHMDQLLAAYAEEFGTAISPYSPPDFLAEIGEDDPVQ